MSNAFGRGLSALAVAACVFGSSSVLAQPDPPLKTTRVASGLTQPLCLAHAPGDATRLFVCERTGRVRVVNLTTNTVLATPFLNLSTLVSTTWLEYGLLSIVFHPDYARNGYFYVNYNPTGLTNADTLVVRYRVSAADPNVADPASATPILRFSFTRREHRAGWMGFGPDGYLYITTGDGGENDPDNAAQTVAATSALSWRGKVLRIDVNGPDGVPGTADDDAFPADANRNYVIPADNPFVVNPGTPERRPELWAYGLRNPWRASFDRLTGDLWIGDVGQSAQEEVDFQRAGVGGLNYGWRCREGTSCTGLTGCTCTDPALAGPVYTYGRTVGVSVTGGYVYRGCAIPQVQGVYFFAEYQVNKLFSFRFNRDTRVVSDLRDRTTELQPGGGLNLQSVAAMAEDEYGELYFADINGGEVFKLVTVTPPRDCNGNGVADTCDQVGPHCAADIDDGTGTGHPDGGVTIDDLLHYLRLYADGLVCADFDNGSQTGTPDGGVTVDDLLYYLRLYEGGC